MEKYTTHYMKIYLADLLDQAGSYDHIDLEELDRQQCIDLWYHLKSKYKILKRKERYVIISELPKTKKHYETLLEKFNIKPESLPLVKPCKKSDKKNFHIVYDKIISTLPKFDREAVKKIKYYSERSTPRLYVDGITRFNMSQAWKDFISKLSEIFIA